MKKTLIWMMVALVATLAWGGPATADSKKGKTYDVTVTNLTAGVIFTPILFVTHEPGVRLFTPGAAAGGALSRLAEGGDTAPLAGMLADHPRVGDLANSADVLGDPPVLFPGQSVTVSIEGGKRFDRLSFAAMLLPTNDGFVALNGIELPEEKKEPVMTTLPGWDAGTELNDEDCAHIPGPQCGGLGEGFNEEDGEGFVHIHGGIHGIGDLEPADHDWKNPIARVVVTRR